MQPGTPRTLEKQTAELWQMSCIEAGSAAIAAGGAPEYVAYVAGQASPHRIRDDRDCLVVE